MGLRQLHHSVIGCDKDIHCYAVHRCFATIAVLCCSVPQGMWNELLGFGDFYYELGVQLLEACLASRCAFLLCAVSCML